MIDWPNVVATLFAAGVGGWVASSIARSQMKATLQVEREKARKDSARELVEAVDSYVHIAYRDQEGGQSKYERQRLRRRILSLCVLTLPKRFADVQEHLDAIDRWWLRRCGMVGVPVAGVGYTATNAFFEGFKTQLFREVSSSGLNLRI